jgi:hypothetical protein
VITTGDGLGVRVGSGLGGAVGWNVGVGVGVLVGFGVGVGDGVGVGAGVGVEVGDGVGDRVGLGVGSGVELAAFDGGGVSVAVALGMAVAVGCGDPVDDAAPRTPPARGAPGLRTRAERRIASTPTSSKAAGPSRQRGRRCATSALTRAGDKERTLSCWAMRAFARVKGLDASPATLRR